MTQISCLPSARCIAKTYEKLQTLDELADERERVNSWEEAPNTASARTFWRMLSADADARFSSVTSV